MQGPESLSHHLCYNNIIIFNICQPKENNRIKNYDNRKIQNKIVFSEAEKRKAKQAYLFYLLFLFPKKINSRKAESRKENDYKRI